MLARLAAIPGVADVRVDCTGRYFAVTPASSPGAPDPLPAVLAALGASARQLPAPDAAAQLEARARGEVWYDARGIRGLSYLEGRVLAARLQDAVRRRAGLSAGEADALGEPLRRTLFGALDRVHDEGGRASSGWLGEAWPALAFDLRPRLAGLLPADRAAAALEAFLAERPD